MIPPSSALFNALASVHVLAGTSLAAQTLLAREGLVREFPTGAHIVREGDEGHSLFILVEGKVEVVKHADSPGAVTLDTLQKGAIFGEMCIVESMTRAASILTLSPVKTIEIKAATLHHLYQQLPDQYAIVLLNLARDMARQLCRLDEAYAARAGLNSVGTN